MNERPTRVHLAVGVTSLEQSRAFYEKYFDQPPTHVTIDQIDWVLDDPAINFSIFYNPERPIGIEHFGLDLPRSKLADYVSRNAVPDDDVAIEGPDGLRVEVFSTDPST